MNKNPWGIVKGTEQSPTDPNKLLEWQIRDEKVKVLIGFALSVFELHHVDLEKSSKEMLDNLNKLFRAKVVNAEFSLKLQLFIFKISAEVTMSIVIAGFVLMQSPTKDSQILA
jgi:hypothetical protein